MIHPSFDAFVAHGFEDEDARSRLDLIDRVTSGHQAMAGKPPVWRWFVPGRVEVFGKHTDYAGGRSLLAAVPRGFALTASPRDDDLVRVVDARSNELRVVRIGGASRPQGRWLKYVAAVIRRLTLNFPDSRIGADLTLASDLPRASGLSSSSALVVGVATALIRRGGLSEAPAWRRSIRTPLDLAGYFGALERGAAFDALAGTNAVGVFGGSEDHTAILTCAPGRLNAYRYQPVSPAGSAPFPDPWRFVIAQSGVVADKAGSARDAYNRASLSAEAVVSAWNAHFGESYRVLADIVSSGPDAVARCRQAIAAAGHVGAFSAGQLVRRLDHFLAEDARIPAALEAFRRVDEAGLGALADASQHDAEVLLENQTVETRALAHLARDHGAIAASSFGAGFGGSVWAISDDAERFSARWVEAYRARFPERAQATCFTARPGPALMEIGPT